MSVSEVMTSEERVEYVIKHWGETALDGYVDRQGMALLREVRRRKTLDGIKNVLERCLQDCDAVMVRILTVQFLALESVQRGDGIPPLNTLFNELVDTEVEDATVRQEADSG